MISISLNMKFWDDGREDSTRIRNVNFSWSELKKLSSFLQDNGVLPKCTLYDFSEKRIIDDSTHIPYPLGVYKKAEKTNIILNQRYGYDFFMMIDCDAFFDKEDYEKLLSVILNLQSGDVVTFDLAKLHNNVSDYLIGNKFIRENSDWDFAYSGNKENGPLNGRIGALGGVYICDTNLLKDLGGFDTKFETWGGEDGEMMDRILTSGVHHNIKSVRDFFPFHLPHFIDWGNKKYNKNA
jgi:hypothetical protein